MSAFGFLLPIFQPHFLSVFTTFGVMAAVSGTRMNMKDLWIAYARASCVQIAKGLLTNVEVYLTGRKRTCFRSGVRSGCLCDLVTPTQVILPITRVR